MVGKTNVVCFVCLLNRGGMFHFSPQPSFFLILPFLGKRTMALFAGAPRATLSVMKSVFIISMALECIVISVSDTNFFDAEVQEPLKFAASEGYIAENSDEYKVKVSDF